MEIPGGIISTAEDHYLGVDWPTCALLTFESFLVVVPVTNWWQQTKTDDLGR